MVKKLLGEGCATDAQINGITELSLASRNEDGEEWPWGGGGDAAEKGRERGRAKQRLQNSADSSKQ